MNRSWKSPALAWVTRILSIAFVALNVWGWWQESGARQDPMLSGDVGGDWLWQWAVLTHLLPLLLMAVATAIGWTRPAFGAIGFGAFTLLQIISVGTEWMYLTLVATIPLTLTVLYVVGAARGRAR